LRLGPDQDFKNSSQIIGFATAGNRESL